MGFQRRRNPEVSGAARQPLLFNFLSLTGKDINREVNHRFKCPRTCVAACIAIFFFHSHHSHQCHLLYSLSMLWSLLVSAATKWTQN